MDGYLPTVKYLVPVLLNMYVFVYIYIYIYISSFILLDFYTDESPDFKFYTFTTFYF